MKIYSPLLLMLLICFISGCEDSASSKKSQKVTEESRKQSEKNTPGKKVSNKKLLNASPKKVNALPQSETDKSFNNDEQDHNQKTLDLSLPFDIEKTTNFPRPEKQTYLPDLFAKNQNKYPLQVGGKIINKVEEEADKERVADGLGIDFNLSH